MKSRFKSILCIGLIALLTYMASCTANDGKSDERVAKLSAENEIAVIDIPHCISNSEKITDDVEVLKGDIIVLDDLSGDALLSQVSVFEIGEDYIGLIDREKLFCYSIPDGRLLGKVDAIGQGPEEYSSITAASIQNSNVFNILVSKWQSSHSEIKSYGMDNVYLNSVQLPHFYGDLYSIDSANYILTGAITTAGGYMPMVKCNIENAIDTIFEGEYFMPKTTFFQTRKIFRNHPDSYYFESCDTIYAFDRKTPTYPKPIFCLNYGGLKFKNTDNKPIHEIKGDYILLTDIKVFNNNVFARVELKNEIYYFVYDIWNDGIRYCIKVEPNVKKFGVPFKIGDVDFCSWPIAYWDGNLLFPVPDSIMSEIFDSEVNPGLLKLSIEALDSYFSKER